jgi:hypothetical protein
LAWRLGRDGAALLRDDGVLLVVGTAEARVATVEVGPELRDAVRAREGGEVDEMHRHGLGKLHVDLLAAIDLRLHLLERPSLLVAEQPGDELENLLDAHAP